VLKPEDKKNFVDLFHNVIINDGVKVGELLIKRSKNNDKVKDPEVFADEIKKIVDEVHKSGLQLGKLGINSLLYKVLNLCYKHQVKLEARYTTVLLAIGFLII
jgi:predicted unusual protein kinase regulating ubiquinone biosynthesis (AarF/ABC1/UbiB family)